MRAGCVADDRAGVVRARVQAEGGGGVRSRGLRSEGQLHPGGEVGEAEADVAEERPLARASIEKRWTRALGWRKREDPGVVGALEFGEAELARLQGEDPRFRLHQGREGRLPRPERVEGLDLARLAVVEAPVAEEVRERSSAAFELRTLLRRVELTANDVGEAHQAGGADALPRRPHGSTARERSVAVQPVYSSQRVIATVV